GTFFHAGQVCESGTRCFVPASIYDEFMARLRERVGHIKLGDTSFCRAHEARSESQSNGASLRTLFP
ncbi:MAG: aldehyde dehydrogenase family protein, partial [Deltaproteobacteria bacterium]|nr:aldehyde dehydrogenase family protein [Deltaproteobacteria bacterium]